MKYNESKATSQHCSTLHFAITYSYVSDIIKSLSVNKKIAVFPNLRKVYESLYQIQLFYSSNFDNLNTEKSKKCIMLLIHLEFLHNNLQIMLYLTYQLHFFT